MWCRLGQLQAASKLAAMAPPPLLALPQQELALLPPSSSWCPSSWTSSRSQRRQGTSTAMQAREPMQ